MVKSAYSSGTPALGVGAGNASAIIDSSADIVNAVNSIIHSKTFDNGMICATEQTLIVDKTIYNDVKKELKARGCYFLNNEEADKLRSTMLINGVRKYTETSVDVIAQVSRLPRKTAIG
jgi:acetaldehyde dehydrogenase/alcohol dehydrogenase